MKAIGGGKAIKNHAGRYRSIQFGIRSTVFNKGLAQETNFTAVTLLGHVLVRLRVSTEISDAFAAKSLQQRRTRRISKSRNADLFVLNGRLIKLKDQNLLQLSYGTNARKTFIYNIPYNRLISKETN
ncbi:hypothetical protein ACOME3_002195 [Neoechinorhynchus agilis]